MPKSNHRKGHKQKINQYRRELQEQRNRRDRMIREFQDKLKSMPKTVGEMLTLEDAKPAELQQAALYENGPAIKASLSEPGSVFPEVIQ